VGSVIDFGKPVTGEVVPVISGMASLIAVMEPGIGGVRAVICGLDLVMNDPTPCAFIHTTYE